MIYFPVFAEQGPENLWATQETEGIALNENDKDSMCCEDGKRDEIAVFEVSECSKSAFAEWGQAFVRLSCCQRPWVATRTGASSLLLLVAMPFATSSFLILVMRSVSLSTSAHSWQ